MSLIGCIDALVQYFNKYAYAQGIHPLPSLAFTSPRLALPHKSVAIYGKTYCQAARATFELIKTHGVEAIVNDSLVSTVLSIGCIAGGIVGAAAGGVGGLLFIGQGDNEWIVLLVLGFCVGFVFVAIAMEVIESGVATFLVCFATDKHALNRTEPELYQKLTTSYQLL
jgi:hypothetical protein